MASSGSAVDSTIIDWTASALGCTPAALRLLIGVLMGYPLAIAHRRRLRLLSPASQHAFFTTSGIALFVFNYGWETLHSIANIVVSYAVLRAAGRTRIGLAINFVFSFAYLLLGYLFTATESYDIKWTMAHCILCLRLIGVAFDYHDGAAKTSGELGEDRRATVLQRPPTLLELFGHSYYFGGCMVGPQFSMRRYQDFVEGRLWPTQRTAPADSVAYSLSRLLLGVSTMAFYQIGAIYVNDKVILSHVYLNEWSWFARWLYLGVYGTVTLHKYVAFWLMAEGSCALSGLSYSGCDDSGRPSWTGLQNIGVWRFETTTNFDGLIRSFNINTNRWLAQYIFKRLKFLGNKDVSQLAALGFLALWHGFHPGYYVCFVNEFLVMKFERDCTQIVNAIPLARAIVYHQRVKWLRLIIMKLYVASLFGYCLVPFTLLTLDRFHQVYASFYYLPSVLLVCWLAVSLQLMPVVRRWTGPRESSNGTMHLKAASTTTARSPTTSANETTRHQRGGEKDA